MPQLLIDEAAMVAEMNKRPKLDASADSALTKETETKPLVKHVLTKELRMYFEKATGAVYSEDAGKKEIQAMALESIRVDPGLHQLLPYFIQTVGEKVG